ncbi:MAG: hypothetical protein A2Y07_11560 [Planctomycetes bacterium GWF2_50_10]|nr:MAG: hypothetical protein A2Y07_11560 [Planctomycetes bacterium GWF2_50_10]
MENKKAKFESPAWIGKLFLISISVGLAISIVIVLDFILAGSQFEFKSLSDLLIKTRFFRWGWIIVIILTLFALLGVIFKLVKSRYSRIFIIYSVILNGIISLLWMAIVLIFVTFKP